MRVAPLRWLAVGALLSSVAVMPAADAEVATTDCEQVRPDGDYSQPPSDTTQTGSIAERLRLPEAHRISRGDGVGVAVLDTGVDPALLPGGRRADRLTARGVQAAPGVSLKSKLYDVHGSQTAALVSGVLPAADGRPAQAIGVAPDAHVVPIRVADGGADVVAAWEDDKLTEVMPDNIAAGIERALSLRKAEKIKVISISLSVPQSTKRLDRALRRAEKEGVLVVASAGNRESGDTEQEKARNAFKPGEDTVPYPARVDSVLAVTAADRDGSVPVSAVATGPAVDVSAPGSGLITLGAQGIACGLAEPATSWAVPQVAGLAALVFAEFDDLNAAQVRTRIEATARGGYRGAALDGKGMIQPLAALTAELDIDRSGELRTPPPVVPEPEELSAPEPEADEMASSRDSMRWWGLGAGGALVLALLIRPLLVRRRPNA